MVILEFMKRVRMEICRTLIRMDSVTMAYRERFLSENITERKGKEVSEGYGKIVAMLVFELVNRVICRAQTRFQRNACSCNVIGHFCLRFSQLVRYGGRKENILEREGESAV